MTFSAKGVRQRGLSTPFRMTGQRFNGRIKVTFNVLHDVRASYVQ